MKTTTTLLRIFAGQYLRHDFARLADAASSSHYLPPSLGFVISSSMEPTGSECFKDTLQSTSENAFDLETATTIVLIRVFPLNWMISRRPGPKESGAKHGRLPPFILGPAVLASLSSMKVSSRRRKPRCGGWSGASSSAIFPQPAQLDECHSCPSYAHARRKQIKPTDTRRERGNCEKARCRA